MRRIVILLAVAAVLAGAWIYSFVSRPAVDPADSGPILTRFSQPYFVKYRRGGDREWSLRAEAVEEAGDGSGAVVFEKVTEGVLYEENRPRFSFVADRGILTEQRDLRLIGNVVFFEDGVAVFESDEVIWESAHERVLSPGRVAANYDGKRVYADRLEADLKSDTVVLTGNVHWTDDDGIQVTADRAVYANEQLEFTGGGRPVRLRLERGSST